MSGSPSLAFLGCGAAARRHAKTLGGVVPDARLHFASRDRARAERFAGELDGAGAYGSYEAALASDAVGVAVVTTPPAEHLPWTLAALEAGKHVVVEKPAFLELDDFERVRAAAARSGRLVLVAENYFYKPLLRRLREVLASGAIGEPLYVCVNATKRQDASGWRADPELAGGGALFEGGIHWIDFMANLGLEVRGISGHFPDGPNGRSAAVVFEYAEGAVGSLLYSWDVPSPLRGLRVSRIYGREGAIAFETNGLLAAVWGRRKRLLFPGLRDIGGERAMWRDFIPALAGGREPELSFELARRDYVHLDAARRGAGGDSPAAEESALESG